MLKLFRDFKLWKSASNCRIVCVRRWRGEKECALKYYAPEFEKEARHDYYFGLYIAECFAQIRENEKPLDFLEIAERTGMVNHKLLSEFNPLPENIRQKPRFLSLIMEAKQLSEEIKLTSVFNFRDESENLEKARMQILQTPNEGGKLTNFGIIISNVKEMKIENL